MSCTFIDDSGQAWVSAFNESALELFGKVDADQLAVYKEEVDGEDGKFESYMKQFNFQRYVLKLRAKADTWNEQTRVKVSIADVKPCDYKAEKRRVGPGARLSSSLPLWRKTYSLLGGARPRCSAGC